MGSQRHRLVTLAVLGYQAALPVAAADSKIEYALRARSETVKQQSDHGEALTLKLRISGTKSFTNEVEGFLQVDHVQSFLNSKHSDGVVLINKPVIADPSGTEVNQLHLKYSTGTTNVTLGRQVIDHGDHRFIGDVGFRQNDQTYDGIRLQHKSINGLELDYAYISKVNRIFGNDAGTSLQAADIRFASLNGTRPTAQLGNHDVDGHLFRGTATVWDYVDLSAFSYIVHNSDVAAFSSRTFGTSADIKYKQGNVKWLASLIFARQKQHERTVNSWLNFYRWEFGAELKPFKLSFRQERFGEQNGVSFSTPLSTLHKFQGWADQFLATPTAGLIDSSVLLLWRKRPFTIDFRYHHFDAAQDRTTIANEFNVDLIYKIDRKHELRFRFAKFNPARGQPIKINNVRKAFLAYSYNF